ncbi:unnamed protein product [Thlaspi arvense]|uniref:non-specific serine/threonine protein kinase n=1 Tax=Thlaspi arvense TaxID=13288 RepID=A0AAU9SLJ1_THLAR|nr:unnamed protein product [Thlaspi arvense]
MYHLPSSCLVLFFLFSMFHHLPCTSSQQELGGCESQFHCGNITAGFPFSGANRPKACGHPSLELHCFNNKASIIISNHLYDVLHIDPKSKTLILDRSELRVSFCNATFTAATLPPEIFELSPTYKNLSVFYLCNPKLPYHSSYTCPGKGLISVSQTLDYHNSCDDSFTINVPKSFVPEEKELNITNLESALREGFDVKLTIDERACQECSSSHGICSFEDTTQPVSFTDAAVNRLVAAIRMISCTLNFLQWGTRLVMDYWQRRMRPPGVQARMDEKPFKRLHWIVRKKRQYSCIWTSAEYTAKAIPVKIILEKLFKRVSRLDKTENIRGAWTLGVPVVVIFRLQVDSSAIV